MHNAFALVDSGATDHVVHDRNLLHNYTPLHRTLTVTVGNGQKLLVAGYGTLVINLKGGSLSFKHTLHVPCIKCNILSVSGLTKAGYASVFTDKGVCVLKDSDTEHIPVLKGKLVDGLYLCDMQKQRDATLYDVHTASSLVAAAKEAWKQEDSEPEIEHIAQSLVLSCAHLYESDSIAELNNLSLTQDNNDTVTKSQTKACNEADLWHSRLGHPAKTTVKHVCDACTGAPSFETLECSYALPCKHCLAGRCPASTHSPIGTHSAEPCEMVFCDLTGPYKKSWNNSRFTLNMVDSCTGYAYTVCMSDKKDTAICLAVGIDRLEQLSGKPVKHIRSDGGTEFFNTQVIHMLGQRKIMYSTTIPWTPQQNGTVERFNRSVMEICRCLLSDSKLSNHHWPQAYSHATYLYNRRVSAGRTGGASISRYEAFTGLRPNISNLKVWGCKVYVRNSKPKNKLEPRAIGGLFMGFDEYSHGYRVKIGNAMYVREDVIFSESELGTHVDEDLSDTPAVPKSCTLIPDTTPTAASTDGPHMQPHTAKTHSEIPTPATLASDAIDDAYMHAMQPGTSRKRKTSEKRTEDPHSPALHTRSHIAGVTVKGTDVQLSTALHAALRDGYEYEPLVYESLPPVDALLCPPAPCMHMFDDARAPVQAATGKLPTSRLNVCIAEQEVAKQLPAFPPVVVGEPLPIPSTVKEAQASPHWPHWHKAISDEYNSMKELNVFELVHLPPNTHVLTSKWVFTWKLSEGHITRAKARIVAKGYQQRDDEYSEVYSPTISQETLRMLLQYTAQTGAYVHQLDVKTAFLYGSISETIHMRAPDGCEDSQGRVWKLLKSLYGLKQAPRAWYKKLKLELNKLGFESSMDDQALFFKMVNNTKLFLCVHVDDMLIIHTDKQAVMHVVDELKKVFTITDVGEVSDYLGMSIKKLTPYKYFLSQPDYTLAFLQKYFDKTQLKPKEYFGSTPLPYDYVFRKLNSPYSDDPANCIPCNTEIYQQIVGKLMWLANVSRPDIIWAVNQCARYNDKPSVAHYKATQYICRYLNATPDYGILFEKCDAFTMVGYCDASHQSCCDTARSCSGMAFMIGKTVIAYQSRMQKTIGLSTAESEYMAMSPCIKHAIWLNRIYTDITDTQQTTEIYVGETVPPFRHDTTSKQLDAVKKAQLIYSDSKSAIAMVNNDQSGKLTKHIAKIYHYAREQVDAGTVTFQHIAGTENLSDIFTKPLPADVFHKHRYSLGMRSYSSLITP